MNLLGFIATIAVLCVAAEAACLDKWEVNCQAGSSSNLPGLANCPNVAYGIWTTFKDIVTGSNILENVDQWMVFRIDEVESTVNITGSQEANLTIAGFSKRTLRKICIRVEGAAEVTFGWKVGDTWTTATEDASTSTLDGSRLCCDGGCTGKPNDVVGLSWTFTKKVIGAVVQGFQLRNAWARGCDCTDVGTCK